jgi:hypothetical protein
MRGGMIQNMVQQKACRESLANGCVSLNLEGANRKRKYDEAFSIVSTLNTFGIITTGDHWVFTKMVHNNGHTTSLRSGSLALALKIDQASQVAGDFQKEQIVKLLSQIVWILREQMAAVESNTELKQLREGVPARPSR